jgi:hypothetical protein
VRPRALAVLRLAVSSIKPQLASQIGDHVHALRLRAGPTGQTLPSRARRSWSRWLSSCQAIIVA